MYLKMLINSEKKLKNSVIGQQYHNCTSKGEFIGGCDIVKEMFEQGDLQKKLQEKNISFQEKNK